MKLGTGATRTQAMHADRSFGCVEPGIDAALPRLGDKSAVHDSPARRLCGGGRLINAGKRVDVSLPIA